VDRKTIFEGEVIKTIAKAGVLYQRTPYTSTVEFENGFRRWLFSILNQCYFHRWLLHEYCNFCVEPVAGPRRRILEISGVLLQVLHVLSPS
jgi:hypothetical protein